MYTNPVHYKEDGKWKEYDHTLVSGMNGYIPVGDKMGVCFSSDPSSEEIFSFNEDEHSISMSVHSEEKQSGSGESASVRYSELPHLYTGEIERVPKNMLSKKYLQMMNRTEGKTELICIMPLTGCREKRKARVVELPRAHRRRFPRMPYIK